MQRTRPGPTAEHDDGYNGDWKSKHGQDTDNGDWKNLSRDVVSMMAIGIGFLAVVPIHGDRESFVFKLAIDPLLDLVRKLIGRGRCCRKCGRNRNSGSSRCRCREHGRRSWRFWRGGRCLCVDGQHQAKSNGAAKNKCFHSFHLPMRCRERRVRIQKNSLLSSKLEEHALSCPKNLGRDGARPAKARERVTRLELSTSSLARRCSTTELHPHKVGSNNRSRLRPRKIYCCGGGSNYRKLAFATMGSSTVISGISREISLRTLRVRSTGSLDF